MKILFISESVWMQGVVYDLHVLAEGLSLLGHKVYAIDPGDVGESIEPREVHRVFPNARVELRSPYIRALSIGGLSLDKSRVVKRLYRAYRRYVDIDQFLNQETIDIIVLYSAMRSGIQTVRLAKKYKVPVVFRNVDKLYNLLPRGFSRLIAKQLEKHVYPRVQKVLALTPKYAEYLIKFGAAREKIDLLVFPIDTARFNPSVDSSAIRQKWGLDDKDMIIVFIGTFYKFGGLIEFVRRFPSVLGEVPQAKLLLVGDGPTRPELDRVVAALKLEQNVIITGYQPFSEMPEYVNAATICLNVFPINKITQDIFSAKIIQYLACGKATVSSALPGITTLLDSQRCGVVYADTVEGLIREIINLLRSPERRPPLGQRGRKYIENAHDHYKVILELEEHLKQVLREADKTPFLGTSSKENAVYRNPG